MIWVLMFGCIRVCMCVCVLTKFTFLREKCGKSQNNHSGKVWEILDNFFFGENGGIEGRQNFEVREGLRWVETGRKSVQVLKLKLKTDAYMSFIWVLYHRDWFLFLQTLSRVVAAGSSVASLLELNATVEE